jgi:hypothetical protein
VPLEADASFLNAFEHLSGPCRSLLAELLRGLESDWMFPPDRRDEVDDREVCLKDLCEGWVCAWIYIYQKAEEEISVVNSPEPILIVVCLYKSEDPLLIAIDPV